MSITKDERVKLAEACARDDAVVLVASIKDGSFGVAHLRHHSADKMLSILASLRCGLALYEHQLINAIAEKTGTAPGTLKARMLQFQNEHCLIGVPMSEIDLRPAEGSEE